ncbi:sensor histidine kinase [Leucobacter allii]|uniref:Sensor histidine kinase n=1 Tax=Leucobacter allii TaxID=2932247 RepID=A0ABY4FIH2_9MICO|nr:sensor histidine kinase [Leucobacter allii]UOQ56464.1 sensor histidine kinase [Leucobacter allii]
MPHPADHRRMLRVARLGLHAILVVLVAVSAVRAVQSGTPLWGAALAAAALLGVFAAGRWASGSAMRGWPLVLAAVWLLALVISPEFVWVSFPLLLVGGHVLRGAAGALFGAVVVAAAVAAPWVQRGGITVAEVLGPVIGGAFAWGIARAYTMLLADDAEHRRLIASLVAARRETEELQAELGRVQREAGASEERTRIARDIHDTIAQEFSSITLLARGAGAELRSAAETEGGGRADEALGRIDAIARRGAEDARRIVRALLPVELESQALTEGLARLVDGFAEESGIAATFEADAVRPLGTAFEVALLRTLQTGLANVRAHAGASRVGIELRELGDEVRLDIVDDGRGFSVPEWEAGSRGVSVGLREARARLRELGGGLEVESEPGEGTALSAWLRLGGAA